MTQTMLSPWLRWLDSARYRDHVERVRSLGAGAVADLSTALPDQPPATWPAPSDLDAVLARLGMVAA